MFRRKAETTEEADSSFDSVETIDVNSLGLVEGVGPSLLPDFYNSGITLKEFITKWRAIYPLEEETDTILNKVEELKQMLWKLPKYTGESGDNAHGRKWYKLWNVDPVEDVKLHELQWCHDLVLFRYLRSYEFKVPQAFLMLKKTLAWRRFKKMDAVDISAIGVSNTKGMVYRKGYDKVGRPIVYYRPKDEVDYDRDNQVLLIFFSLELSMQTLFLERGNDKVIIIIDLGDWSISKMPTLELVIDTVRALSEHYTDVMHEVIIIDGPMLVDPLMQMIKAVLDSSTAKKITMKHRGPKLEQHLKNRMDDSQIEESMGGTNMTKYDHELYWKHETEQARLYKQRIDDWCQQHEQEWLKLHEK
ncbi:CRAL TRIO domain-containing, putative [Babesia ovis]|uniref:CRAL TRIO domain-containing, putative n=1 Tax=Babesia ovis TaxID=5869 RepID=A0A9W5TBQ4_BABOV|nr:CRAL TRIO domain-containing, putative [Babesia ovis]